MACKTCSQRRTGFVPGVSVYAIVPYSYKEGDEIPKSMMFMDMSSAYARLRQYPSHRIVVTKVT